MSIDQATDKLAQPAPTAPGTKLWQRVFASPRARRAGIGGAMLIAAGTLTSLIMATGPDGSAAEQSEKAWPVTVMRANPSELHPMFATYGRVEARTEAKLRTDIEAEVEQVFVQEGEWAEEGELLLQMRAEEIELRLREAKAEAQRERASLRAIQIDYDLLKKTTNHYENMHRLAQQKLTRQQELAEKRMIPQAMLDTAVQQASRDTIEYQNHKRQLANFPSQLAQREAAVTIAGARAERAQLDLDKTKVYAPFTGPVMDVFVGQGDRTNQSLVLLTMADASSFEVRASVPNQYADRVRNALAAKQTITADITADSTATGNKSLTLSRIAHNVRPGQSGLDAWFAFPGLESPANSHPTGLAQVSQTNRDALPALGRVINLNAVLPSEPGLIALPGQAIYNNDRVYLVNNNRLQATTVTRVGEFRALSGDYQVLVRGDNLSQGADVMTTALPKAISGLLVDPIRPVSEAVVNTLAPQSSVMHRSTPPHTPAPAPTA